MASAFRLPLILGLLLTVSSTGCENYSAPPPVVKVKGTLIHNGKPLEQASIGFHSVGSSSVGTATTAAEGKFELNAVVGENVVTVSVGGAGGGGASAGVMSPDAISSGAAGPLVAAGPTDSAAAAPSGPTVPSEYSGATTSPLKVTVSADGETDLKVEF